MYHDPVVICLSRASSIRSLYVCRIDTYVYSSIYDARYWFMRSFRVENFRNDFENRYLKGVCNTFKTVGDPTTSHVVLMSCDVEKRFKTSGIMIEQFAHHVDTYIILVRSNA